MRFFLSRISTVSGLLKCSLLLLAVGCGTPLEESTTTTATSMAKTELDPPPEAPDPPPYEPHTRGSLTFTGDIAPIVFRKCSDCHRPGQIGPFPLLCYEDVKKRARQISEITTKQLMPPWAPLPGFCNFERDRSLSRTEIGMIAQWVSEGAIEGNPSDLPPLPKFVDGWKYGQPDLVVTMPEPFSVPAESTADVYRKFVIRVPIDETKYVKAFDFNPGNNNVVHHMRLRVDTTGMCRTQDQQDLKPGFDGTMFSGDHEPDGFFLVWTPGYEAVPRSADVAWTLPKGADLVLELHLHPSGKAETVESSIALYFQPSPPVQHLHMVQMECQTIDIPPGKKNVEYEDRYVLPADTSVLAVMPHAHFLATHFRTWAILPDGRKIWLMRIADWDFNWQREYTYADPIQLPKGTMICMRVTYDNSADNPRNPHNPPHRVLIGRDTYEEMAQVFLQVIAANPDDGELLNMAFRKKEFDGSIQREQFIIERGRGTAESHFNLGCYLSVEGKLSDAMRHYEESIRLKPDNFFAVNNLGSLYRNLGRLEESAAQYRRAIEMNPQEFRVHYNLGLIYYQTRQWKLAAMQFEDALRINPDIGEAWFQLGLVAAQQSNFPLAKSQFERALQVNPQLEPARNALQQLKRQVSGSR